MKASILAIFVLIIVAVGVSAWYFHKEKPQASCSATSPQPAIVAFGDSLVAGYGATAPGGFVTMLASSTKTSITNLGRNGDTTTDAKTRLPQVLARKPDIVLVLLGGNDALQKVPQETTRANLDEIITTLQQGGSRVILLGVLGGLPWSDPYSGMFSDLAKAHSVAYVPNVLSGIIGHQDLMSDQVHPNDAGYAKIAARIAPVLESECGKVAHK